jgi:hypothetical protein
MPLLFPDMNAAEFQGTGLKTMWPSFKVLRWILEQTEICIRIAHEIIVYRWVRTTEA